MTDEQPASLEDALSRFPGPITFYAPKLAWLDLTRLSFIIVILSLIDILVGYSDGKIRAYFWGFVCLAFSGYLLLMAHRTSKEPTKLILDENGMEYNLGKEIIRIGWRDVSNFETFPWRGMWSAWWAGAPNHETAVTFDNNRPDKRFVNKTLPDVVGMPPAKLAKLLADWQTLALKSETKTPSS